MADLLVRNIPADLKERLADYAEREERSMAWVVRRALEEFLGRDGEGVPEARPVASRAGVDGGGGRSEGGGDPPDPRAGRAAAVERLRREIPVSGGARSPEDAPRRAAPSGCLHPPVLRLRGVCKGCGERVK